LAFIHFYPSLHILCGYIYSGLIGCYVEAGV